MKEHQLHEIVSELELIAHDLHTENVSASNLVRCAAKSMQEMHLVIELLKAKVELLEFQLEAKSE